ncbi:MAG: hypothetical protein J0M12_11915, partial [Deltaproteobacteria bacterium]|nr:hypothetical protein [Deltaproteobacteria bacterium]
MFRYLAIVGCVLLGIGLPNAQAETRAWNSRDFFQLPKKYKKKPIACFQKGQRFQVGYSLKQGKKKVWTPYTSKADKRALKKLGYPANCQAERICKPNFRDIDVEVGENNSGVITPAMVVVGTCTSNVMLTILADPTHGAASTDGAGISYTPSNHFRGNDQIRVGMQGSSVVSNVGIRVVATKSEFAGNPASLEPYREDLTANEVRALLKRVALGGDQGLFTTGMTQGRAALVEALLAQESSSEIEDLTAAVGDLYGNYKPGFPAVTGGRAMWEVPTTRAAWAVELFKGAPLKQVAMMNLHDHFAANLSVVRGPDQVGLMFPIKDHYLKLQDFALGSLDEFLHELNYDTVMG